MKINLDNIPGEVLQVWAVSWSGFPIGLVLMKKCDEIIEKFPEWFPKHKKYQPFNILTTDQYCKLKINEILGSNEIH